MTTPRRAPAAVALAAGLLAAVSGCARDRSQITPTTLGTDLRALPRGRMTPQPFPGSSLARAEPAAPGTGDPAAVRAGGGPGPQRPGGSVRR